MRKCLFLCLLAFWATPATADFHAGNSGNWVFSILDGTRTAAHVSTNAELRVTCPQPGASGSYTVFVFSEGITIDGLTDFGFDGGEVIALPMELGRFEVLSPGSGQVFAQFIALLRGSEIVSIVKDGRSQTSFSLNGAREVIGACPVEGL